ncbi:MAG: ArsA family ATPase [Thermoleophilaceae bacterium]|nr:ArsA family ATPase [Thermoleophilaceae bacterium]
MSALAAALEGREVVVCAGPGGVGKTTSAAAIGLAMAARGRRVAVLTIDPARRLADSLGLEEIGGEERRVDPERLSAAGVEASGELWAAMLDAKRTWDELIERHAPDERTRDAVLGNRIYKELSSAVAGSQEYMAMEKLHELHAEGRYDLLVLDTPPTRNALDFLDAPERLSRFIDSRSLRLFLRGNRGSLKLLGRSSQALFAVLRRITGVDLLEDMAEFFHSFGGMSEGFERRAREVNALLADGARTTFVVVASPAEEAVDEAIFFRRRLRESGLPFGAAVVNRVHSAPGAMADPGLQGELVELVGENLARRVVRNDGDWRALAERDRLGLERLAAELEGELLVRVPDLDDDVHDLDGLVRVNEHLFASETTSRRRARLA